MQLKYLTILVMILILSGCGGTSKRSVYYQDDGPPSTSADYSNIPDAVPRLEPKSRGGNPESYVVFGKRYYVKDSSKGFVQRGIASWYGKQFHGRRTSSGEIYNMHAMTAAHKSLPLPTYAQVTNLKTGKQIVVRINDRGPFHEGRIIDLSYAAAHKLGTASNGTGLVEVRAIDPLTWDTERKQSRHVASTKVVNPDAKIYLQLGAFSVRSNAEKLVVKTIGNAISGVFLSEDQTDFGNTIYRVRVGPLASVDTADNMISLLLKNGFDDFHVVIE
ncbi:MAG: septal ring lytic transglycosylase RlpA family protein [Gammaproteobacteria bacterium]|nr:MAG: septal ring lytic transglycosylase RlpA family protein [Gammaproteobacteria bacterium]